MLCAQDWEYIGSIYPSKSSFGAQLVSPVLRMHAGELRVALASFRLGAINDFLV